MVLSHGSLMALSWFSLKVLSEGSLSRFTQGSLKVLSRLPSQAVVGLCDLGSAILDKESLWAWLANGACCAKEACRATTATCV